MFLHSFSGYKSIPRTFLVFFSLKVFKSIVYKQSDIIAASATCTVVKHGNNLYLPGTLACVSFTDLKPYSSDVMAVKIVITKEQNSAKFTDRVLIISSDPVLVSRSSREQRSDTSNAVFDCKVSSMKHFFLTLSLFLIHRRFCPSLMPSSVSAMAKYF